MTKRLIKITNTRPNTETLWWWEAAEQLASSELLASANNFESNLDARNPNRFSKAHMIHYWLPEPDSLYCYSYHYYESLQTQTPKLLLDWFIRETRKVSLELGESGAKDIKTYIWWLMKYRHENNILMSNLEIVNSDEVSVWPQNV